MQPVLRGAHVVITVITIALFLMYDRSVTGHHQQLVHSSAQATEFVSSMFPENLHRQLFAPPMINSKQVDVVPRQDNQRKTRDLDEECGFQKSIDTTDTTFSDSSSSWTQNSLQSSVLSSPPIAELYPETTVLLADLAGFTAWSAERDPTQVFILLETIFLEFDRLASRRDIFKVETVGDCYVAVAGVPEPQPDHPVVMARFARDCMLRFETLMDMMEGTLGGTRDLGLRIGLHSGPITGGVLRGDRRRFQLFGDTINTAARMESHSVKGRVQVSETTAQLLIQANKQHWLVQREDRIEAKGKGHLQTYWLDIHAQCASMVGSSLDGVV